MREFTMPTITVKNIPPDLYDLLKQSAAANRRSINSEIITYIERGVRGRRFDREAIVERARELRRGTRSHPITAEEFDLAKRTGRA